jgi:pyruvate, water dikinase
MGQDRTYVRWFDQVGCEDTASVGGKNASLGEMIRGLAAKGIKVPNGFATTASAYRYFLEFNGLVEGIRCRLEELRSGQRTLAATGRTIRRMINNGLFPDDLEAQIVEAYRELASRYGTTDLSVAVRSSATAEDLPGASFAGQQETFLNVRGEHDLMDACLHCVASLFTDRAIAYRHEMGFDHTDVALSIGVQKMVRSDQVGAGVMFTLDPDTGFPHVVVIDAAWGLGESVVQGIVTPDEFLVFKPLLHSEGVVPIVGRTLGDKRDKLVYSEGNGQATKRMPTSLVERRSYTLDDADVLQLARWACLIEEHYGTPMDIEWAKDGETGELFILQARPETVQSFQQKGSIKAYSLKEQGKVIATGLSIGQAIAAGAACVIEEIADIQRFRPGSILVTGQTDPDWVPIMKQAAGIVTDHGGRTSHAAIVSRELGIPAVVGTGNATRVIQDGEPITICSAEGDEGKVYQGILAFDAEEIDWSSLPTPPVEIMLNVASPLAAFSWWRLPAKGVGLARMEFIINNVIKAHPLALLRYPNLQDQAAVREIGRLTEGYENKAEYFIEQLACGIAKIAAAQYPNDVLVRLSDFKTNEYANLIGGREFEPVEENPMLGFRGASRYYSEQYRQGFALECAAIKRAREHLGLRNIVVMVPFCRTPQEADSVLEVMAENGLRRGEDGLKVFVMAEIPSNIILAEEFAQRFDGFSIGSNDLTQLILGVDRDSEALAGLFDERNDAVKWAINELIRKAHASGRKVGICGQAPSDYPDFAEFLIDAGIDSISLNPDSVVRVLQALGSHTAARV